MMRASNLVRMVTTIVLACSFAFTAGACGSKPNVIEQAEDKCGVQSERGKKIEYFYSVENRYGDINTLTCLTNLMPDNIYEHYDTDGDKARLYYDIHKKPLQSSYEADGYRWSWRMGFTMSSGEIVVRIEKL